MADYQEGQTATSKDGKSRVVYKSGMWVKDTSFTPAAAERVKTTPQDMQALNAASDKAQTERDSMRTYVGAAQAVDDMGTGPWHSKFLDAITPDEDGGILDTIGATLGTLARPFVSQKTLDARDHLKTVNANVALAGSQQMKGSSSDKDTALMRLSGVGPTKQPIENHRIIDQAIHDSGLAQARALTTSNWIAHYGSISNPSPNGTTFQQSLQATDAAYERHLAERQAARRMPKAPPGIGRGGPVTIDLNGNPIQ